MGFLKIYLIMIYCHVEAITKWAGHPIRKGNTRAGGRRGRRRDGARGGNGRNGRSAANGNGNCKKLFNFN